MEEFVKAQTPTQLFAKGPRYRGHIISSRVNERWALDFIDFKADDIWRLAALGSNMCILEMIDDLAYRDNKVE